MGIPDHLIWLLRSLWAGQELIARTGNNRMLQNWEQSMSNQFILSSCSFNLYAEYIMQNSGLDDSQVGIKVARKNIDNLRYAADTTSMAESEEELKSLLMRVKGKWESWLKIEHSKNKDHGIWSHHFMTNRWWKTENSDRFYFLVLQITGDSDSSMKLKDSCSLEEKLWQT